MLTAKRGSEPMGTIQRRNTSESLLDGIRENIQVANLPSAEDGFHLRPHFLSGVKVWTAWCKILCKRNSTKSRMALEKQCRWRAESLGYPWPSVARRYARRRRECRRTSEGTLKQGVSRRHGRRT